MYKHIYIYIYIVRGHQLAEGGQIALFNCIDVDHKPPDFGELTYQSRIPEPKKLKT